MDQIDKRILEMLAENAEIATAEIGQRVGLSAPAVNKRIAKLKKDGVIRSFTVLTDGTRIEKGVTAFILVVLQYKAGVEDFMDFVHADRDILECYAISGGYDYILKVCAKDIPALEQKLLQIKGREGVVKSQTMISLMEHKMAPTVLPELEEDE